MRLPESVRPAIPTEATAATAPLRISSASSIFAAGDVMRSNFAQAFGTVQAEVADFIENGARNQLAAPLPSLSIEGNVYRNGAEGAPASAAASAGADALAQQEFLSSISSSAQEAGRRLGVSPDIVAAHAALESGWGQRPLRQADGGDSNNLFGIKAGGNWRGEVAQAATTEYEAGGAVSKIESFRSYPDRVSAFRDYAQLLSSNPRYRGVLNAGNDAKAFARALVQGGYATDPAYAEKLTRLAARIQSARSGE